MSDSLLSLFQAGITTDADSTTHQVANQLLVSASTPPGDGGNMLTSKRFWFDRLIECGLILSLALFYLIGNRNISFPIGNLGQADPLLAWPFLLIFAGLSWYRLPFALALFPLTLPFYLYPKVLWGTVRFSPAEIALWTMVAVVLLQALVYRRKWPYRRTFTEFRNMLGPFVFPIVVFALFALVSVFIASSRGAALRTFRQDVLGPLVYVGLILCCLRTKQDITRLLCAVFGTGLLVALIGISQYLTFLSLPLPKSGELPPVTAIYGNQNSVGLLFDYTLPIGLSLFFARVNWKVRVLALLLCIPFVFVLLQSQSRGAAFAAFPIVLLFLIVLAVRNKRVLIYGSLVALVLGALLLGIFGQKVVGYVNAEIINGHTNSRHVSTVQKRLYLWQSASQMIAASPWLGYGLDNWLCHYSDPVHSFHYKKLPDWAKACQKADKYYRIDRDANKRNTYMNEEPDLSHPHNIFLHVWVSIGLFGLLAFVALLGLFTLLFVMILASLAKRHGPDTEHLRWLTVAIGASMLAAVVQGMVDSALLEQDLASCFWLLIAALLVVRSLTLTPATHDTLLQSALKP